MAKQTISQNDSGSQAAEKMNANFTELYNGQGGSSGDTTPTGIIARNQDAIARIAAARKHVITKGIDGRNYANNFVVAHGSDFHTDKTRWRNFLDFGEGVSAIDLLVATGDFVAQECVSGTDQIDYMMDELDDANITKDILLVTGNHDRYGLTDAQTAGAFDLAGRGLRNDNDNSYYYVDYPNNNNEKGTGPYGPSSMPDMPSPNIDTLRFIVMNQYDADTTSRTILSKDYHFSEAQITWLLNLLSDTPATTGVIVVMHGRDGVTIPSAQGKKFGQRHYIWQRSNSSLTYGTDTLIEDIINAWRNGTSINKTYTLTDSGGSSTLTVQKSFLTAGSFICYMIGHSHADMIGYSSKYPDQLYLHCPCSCHTPDFNNSGELNGSNRYSYGNEVGDMPRRLGDRTQDCFNVYGIDTVNKVIKVVRVGSDINDLGDDKRMDWYEYQPTIS